MATASRDRMLLPFIPQPPREESLLRQVEHWHQLFMDSEASFAQLRADEAHLQKQLSSALKRERLLAAKNLELRCRQDAAEAAQEETCAARKAMSGELSSARLMLQCKDEELHSARRQLSLKDDELEKLKADLQSQILVRAELGKLQKELQVVRGELAAKELEVEKVEKEKGREAREREEAEKEKENARAARLETAREFRAFQESTKELQGQVLELQRQLEKQDVQHAEHIKAMEVMRWEVSDAQQRLEKSLGKLAVKEEEIVTLQQQVEAKDLKMRELRGQLDSALLKITAKDLELSRVQSAESQELRNLNGQLKQELQKLNGQLVEQHELCHTAISDNCELRQIYGEKLQQLGDELGEQKVKHQRSVKLLEAEKEMWLTRSDHLEKINTRLRLDLARSPSPSFGSLTPSPPSVSPRARLNYPRAGRTLLHRSTATDRYDESGKLRSFDAQGREI